jgi:membrane protein YdbS with pleckstrin-like domain
MTERSIVIEVQPHRNLRVLYLTCLLFVIWAGVLSWLVPLSLFLPPFQTLLISLGFLLLVVLTVWWTGAYVRTITYRFDPTGISWEKGVFFHRSGFISYHRIIRVDVVQGPLYRLFKLFRLKIQVVKPSSDRSPYSVYIVGLTKPGPLRDCILIRQKQDLSQMRELSD